MTLLHLNNSVPKSARGSWMKSWASTCNNYIQNSKNLAGYPFDTGITLMSLETHCVGVFMRKSANIMYSLFVGQNV